MDYSYSALNSKLCENISNKFHKQLIKLAVRSLSQADIDENIIAKLRQENDITDEHFCDLIGMYITIINLYLVGNKEDFEEKLLNAGYTQSFIDDLPFKHEDKDVILTNIQEEHNTNLDYKIDISLSNNVFKKTVPPWVIFNLTQDDKNVTFSADSATFHKLRYNLALILKELNAVKSMNIFKK